jgi:diaminopropionate ammonia-lyase
VQPRIYIVEPVAAPCLAQSHAQGRAVRVEGPVSNMGRLDCKEPSLIARAIFERCDVEYLQVGDDAATRAAATLEQHGLSTTPSGAAGFAALTGQGETPGPRPPLVIVTETGL